MDSLPDGDWDFDYYSRLIDEAASTDIFLNDTPREHDEPCAIQGSKACRDKMRRDRINKRFLDLSMLLEPGMPVKTDKCAVLNDVIRVLTELKAEAQELKEANKKLEEDIKNLKEEKHELREEKSLLRAEKERMEEHVKALSISTAGYVPAPPAAYHAGVSKLMAFPSYGATPMWQWIPPDVRDISKDHELRPPLA